MNKKLNSNFPGAREWRDKFYFLKNNGTEHLFLFLLGIAQSKRDLNRLHDCLAPNTRLLRPQLIDLENFWEKYFLDKNQVGKRTKALSAKNLNWIIYNIQGSGNNTKYYLDYLLSRSISSRKVEGMLGQDIMVVNGPTGVGHGGNHFVAEIFQTNFDLECRVDAARKNLSVCIYVWQNILTEELTHKIGELPGYYARVAGASTDRGLHLDLIYAFPAAGLIEYLEEFTIKNHSGCFYFKPSQEFIEKLQEKLQSVGVALDGLKFRTKY